MGNYYHKSLQNQERIIFLLEELLRQTDPHQVQQLRRREGTSADRRRRTLREDGGVIGRVGA